MTTRTTTYQVCDGCHMSTFYDNIEIVRSKSYHEWEGGPVRTIDLCAECEDKERFICNLCKHVHDQDHPCEWMEQRIWESSE